MGHAIHFLALRSAPLTKLLAEEGRFIPKLHLDGNGALVLPFVGEHLPLDVVISHRGGYRPFASNPASWHGLGHTLYSQGLRQSELEPKWLLKGGKGPPQSELQSSAVL